MTPEHRDNSHPATGRVSRRNFLRSAAAVAVLTDAPLLRSAVEQVIPAAPPTDGLISGSTEIHLTINGQRRSVTVEPRTTLLSAMRDRLEPALTGPKLVCDAGSCGACTVLMDGLPVYGCSVMALDGVGRAITTVEGLGTPDKPSIVQAAFCEKDAMMCGFCTSGFVTTLTSVLNANLNASPQQVREGCKGNFCRCGTFPHIFEAAQSAAEKMRRLT